MVTKQAYNICFVKAGQTNMTSADYLYWTTASIQAIEQQ
jgi:hypothetical protein